MRHLKLFLMAIMLMVSTATNAQFVPDLIGFVNDYANQMTMNERQALSQQLGAFQEEKRVTIVVLTAPPAEQYGYADMAQMGTHIFNTWKIGSKEHSSGILILVTGMSPPYKARIITGRGAEGAVTDLQSQDIVDRIIKPALNSGHFAEGVSRGAQALMNLTKKEFAHTQEKKSDVSSYVVWTGLGGGLVIIPSIIFFFYRKKKREDAERKRVQQQHWDAMRRPPAPAPRPHAYPRDAWSRETSYSSYRAPRRAPPAPSPQRSASRSRSEVDDDSTTHVVYVSPPPPTASPSYGGWSGGDTSSPPPSPSVDTGGSSAGGGGGDL